MFSLIKSRPQYEGLRPMVSAKRHLIAAEGEGATAVLKLFSEAPDEFAPRAEIFYAGAGPNGDAHFADLQRAGAKSCRRLPDPTAILQELDGILASANMGTRLYAAGTEGFIGRVVRLGIDHGVDHRSVLTEHRGSLARRVQCVHCKGFTENVTTSIFECGHCGNLLFVRDHYSRRLAAFQGVVVNAEEPGSRPQAEEVYL